MKEPSKIERIAADPVVRQLAEAGESAAKIFREYVEAEYGGTERNTRRALQLIRGTGKPGPVPKTNGASVTESDSGTAIDTGKLRLITRDRITSLDDLLTVCKVDREGFEVKDYRVSTWETKAANDKPHTLFQVRANLVPTADIQRRHELRIEALREIVSKGAPKLKAIRRKKPSDRHLFELSMADLHVGKYAWGEETGEDYDSDIASDRFRDALESLADRGQGFGVERVLYVVGNDLLQVDNERNETTRGTRQDVDTRYMRMYRTACELQVEAIERLRHIAPVDVLTVPGNHDTQSAFTIGHYLKGYFRLTDDVRVDDGAVMRKYFRYGTNLIGLTHGNNEKHDRLPLIMAEERRRDWAETTHHEWHLGHLHKRKETRYNAGDTHGGVVVRILPSLSGTDKWHHDMGYVGSVKACEAYLHHHDMGYAGHLSYNVQKTIEVAA